MECQLGDVDGDGDDDAIRFDRDAVLGSTGRVYVALNDGFRFGSLQRWHTGFCSGADQCHVGDVNGDGKADLVAFPKMGGDRGVYVAQSTGTNFDSVIRWSGAICDPTDDCRIGDFNGDGKADAVAFVKGSDGSIFVALSDGSRFGSATRWGFGCFNNEVCAIGKVSAGGAASVISFTHGNPANPGEVYVSLSNRSTAFSSRTLWRSGFFADTGPGHLVMGDVSGDGLDDIVAFVQNAKERLSPVIVVRSTGSAFESSDGLRPWHDHFCDNGSSCRVGRANTDAKMDAFSFVKDTPKSTDPADPLKGDAQVTKSQ